MECLVEHLDASRVARGDDMVSLVPHSREHTRLLISGVSVHSQNLNSWLFSYVCIRCWIIWFCLAPDRRAIQTACETARGNLSIPFPYQINFQDLIGFTHIQSWSWFDLKSLEHSSLVLVVLYEVVLTVVIVYCYNSSAHSPRLRWKS